MKKKIWNPKRKKKDKEKNWTEHPPPKKKKWRKLWTKIKMKVRDHFFFFFKMEDLQRFLYDWSSPETSQWTQTSNWVDGVAVSQGIEIRGMAEKEENNWIDRQG